ncbi:MAG: MBL fold metallo-hydrolase [Ruminococcaceae bacterium]|nr:MBL fold metallo-hydrolase [Oscillospiraceae bacterium]
MMPPLTVIFGSYEAKKYDEGTWFINFMEGSQNLYLLEGEEKALLIDTGYGTNTLAAFVKNITDKPLLVANTHFHPDHAGGNGEFPSIILHHNWKADAGAVQPGPNLPFDISALPYPDYEKILLHDGDVIDLGSRKIRVLEICAHSNSSLAFLDEDHRFLICGDELEAAQVLLYPLSGSDEYYDLPWHLRLHRENMRKLKQLQPKIDHLLPNHNGFPISPDYIDRFIALVDAIFAGSAVIEDRLNHRFIEMDPIAPKLCRVKHNGVSFFVEKEKLLAVYGKGEL